MKKAIILHSVAVNGGDQLLYDVAVEGLREFSRTEVIGQTTNNSLSKEFLGKNTFLNQNFVGKRANSSSYLDKIVDRLSLFRYEAVRSVLALFDKNIKEANKYIEEADYFILGPGGYMHEEYGFEHIVQLVERINQTGKPIHLLSQSVGPFNSSDAKRKAKNIFERCDKIIFREKISEKYAMQVGVKNKKNVYTTTDIAFAKNYFMNSKKSYSNRDKKITLNFRKWTHKTKMKKIIEIGSSVLDYAVEKGYKVEFISTSQGVEGYYDDSDVAKKILKKSKVQNESKKVNIQTKRFSPGEVTKKISKSEAFVGMRLHTSICAILAGVPAFNIGYQHKSPGVYETIGNAKYSTTIYEKSDEIIDEANAFIDGDRKKQVIKFEKSLNKGTKKAIKTFKILENK